MMDQLQATNLLKTAAGMEWREVGVRNHHGINVPLFSLHSAQSCGIGEFPDLIPLIDWCKSIGYDVIQLLPLNDGGPEPSPYSALSAYALNPLHLGLSHLLNVNKVPDGERMIAEMRELNKSDKIDYKVLQEKREAFLRRYFEAVGPAVCTSYDYLLFLSNNAWVEPYALFKAIKINRHWEPWSSWPQEMANPTPASYQQLLQIFKQEANFHRFVQYLCFKQFSEVKKACDQKGIFLKGDIPILINRESADVWRFRSFFNLHSVAGAPPDMYSAEGQKWGFPLYNWGVQEVHNYDWWKVRLKVASALYHIYRIDHIVGFYRIWAIPEDKPAKEGHYDPGNKAEWIPHGEKIMRMMLQCSKMLPIAEDLGTVPPEVRTSLRHLGICGTKVIRWERRWEGDHSFIDPKDYLIESMTTVSTHDSEPLQLWWTQRPDEAREYAKFKGWTYQPKLSPEHHREILLDSHRSASLFHVNLLQEYLALIPGMTRPNPEDERVNVPGVISDRNWSYKFLPSVEEITSNPQLAEIMRSLIS